MSSILGISQIAVNTADLANGASIAAYLTDAVGNLLNSAAIGGSNYLLSKDASDYAEDTAHVSGDFGSFVLGVRNDAGTSLVDTDGDYAPLSLDATGALRVNASVSFPSDYAEDSPSTSGDMGSFSLAVRRDVRSSAVDTNGDYASFNVNAVGELWVKDADALVTLNSILTQVTAIDAQTLSIQNTLTALSKAEDAASVSGDQGIQALAVRKDAQGSNVNADGDYASLLTWSEGSLKVVDIANGSILQQQVSVTSTAAAVPAAPLANRKSLMIQNTGSVKMYVGSATVTTTGATAGIELNANGFMELEVGPAVPVFVVKAGAGGATLNVLEMA